MDSLQLMGKAFLVLLVLLIGVVLFALMGDTLPEGSFLRGISDSLRSIGRSIGDGFGGGYRPLPAG